MTPERAEELIAAVDAMEAAERVREPVHVCYCCGGVVIPPEPEAPPGAPYHAPAPWVPFLVFVGSLRVPAHSEQEVALILKAHANYETAVYRRVPKGGTA